MSAMRPAVAFRPSPTAPTGGASPMVLLSVEVRTLEARHAGVRVHQIGLDMASSPLAWTTRTQ
jgi:hypothetical protein